LEVTVTRESIITVSVALTVPEKVVFDENSRVWEVLVVLVDVVVVVVGGEIDA
jgi:hypothetical protein